MAPPDRWYLLTTLTNFTLVLLILTTSSGIAQPLFKVSDYQDELLVNNSYPSNSSKCAKAISEVWNHTSLLELYLDAIGRPQSGLKEGNFDWLGSYSECTRLIPHGHYCLAFVEVFNASIRWGLCVPQECSEDDVTHALQDVFTSLRKRNITNVHLDPQPVSDFLGDDQSKAVYCAKPSQYTTGVIVTLILCGLILFLCLLGTTVEIIVDFSRQPAGSVNKTEGFMPAVRHDSMATNNVRFPYFANDDGESNNLIQSCPDRKGHDAGHSLQSLNNPTIKPNVLVQFFLCFSLVKNTNRIMDTKIPPGAITSINGMRVLSMWWVILGHTYATRLEFGSVSNLILLGPLLQRFTFLTVDNATFSVDSFFFLSGLLVSYLSLREMEKKHGRFPLFKFYFHRFWRLTPTYMFILLFFDKLVGFLGEGPFWYELQVDPACDKYWWTNLLYINNFYPTAFADSCMPWAWYLANDMQFFIISPIIVYVAYRFRLRGLGTITGVLLCGSFVTIAVLFYHYDLVVQIFGNQKGKNLPKADFNSIVYVKPYCRIAPYLVGIVLGYVLHIKIRKITMVYIFNVIGWCIAIVLALSTLYGEYKVVKKHGHKPFSRAENIMYGTFSRFAWSLALAWVIYACHRGLGGLVNSILSARFWIPLGRLTYCAYLVHPIAIITLFGSYETVQAYSDVHIAFTFVGLVCMSYLAAFIVSVCVEYPMMQLEKLIFKTNR